MLDERKGFSGICLISWTPDSLDHWGPKDTNTELSPFRQNSLLPPMDDECPECLFCSLTHNLVAMQWNHSNVMKLETRISLLLVGHQTCKSVRDTHHPVEVLYSLSCLSGKISLFRYTREAVRQTDNCKQNPHTSHCRTRLVSALLQLSSPSHVHCSMTVTTNSTKTASYQALRHMQRNTNTCRNKCTQLPMGKWTLCYIFPPWALKN